MLILWNRGMKRDCRCDALFPHANQKALNSVCILPNARGLKADLSSSYEDVCDFHSRATILTCSMEIRRFEQLCSLRLRDFNNKHN